MSGVLNDFICDCDFTLRNVVLPSGEAPEHCGKRMQVCWDHGHPPATDIHEPVYCEATGEFHQSNRQAEERLGEQARVWSDKNGLRWEPPVQAGDKVGGARNETRSTGMLASYAGQGSRRSRSGSQAGSPAAPAVQSSANPDDYAVKGIKPRRMTRDEATEARKGTVYA